VFPSVFAGNVALSESAIHERVGPRSGESKDR
jgi:hypothetical protein